MDPFTGLGSTAVACARLGLNFVGAELDEMYLGEAVERMEAAVQDDRLPGKGVAKMRKATTAAPPRARQASGA
jgi:site-specific DNA-methyltransferase (adenine-specific)